MDKKTTGKPKFNFIKRFFGGWISNDSAIEGSKEYPWWIAIIIGLFSVAIALVPTFVSLVNQNGSSMFATYNFDYDRNIHQFAQIMKGNGESEKLFFEEDKLLTYTGAGIPDKSTESYKAIATIESPRLTIDRDGNWVYKTEYEFIAYYVNAKMSERYEAVINQGILKNICYKVNTTEPGDISKDPEGQLYYCPNYLFLFKDGFSVICFKSNTTTVATGSASFNFAPYKKGDKFIDSFAGSTIIESYNKFLYILDSCYQDAKMTTLGTTTGIYAGVFAGMLLILGLMMFLMTRGKNNMFNYLTFMDTLKMILWASFSPALLSLILGFLIARFAMVFFIIMMGIRAMWISMKQLRPM